MKKYYSILCALMLAILTPAFTACGSDDEDEPDSSELLERMQGHWSCTKSEASVMGQSITMTREEIDRLAAEEGKNYMDLELDISGSYINGYRISLNGNRMQWHGFAEYSGVDFVVRISGSTMTLTADMIDEDTGATIHGVMYYTRTSRSAGVATAGTLPLLQLGLIQK